MAGRSDIAKEIARRHQRLLRYLNDAWIFSDVLRPKLADTAKELRTSKNKAKKDYDVPKGDVTAVVHRRDDEIGQLFQVQHERGLFETNIVSMVSRFEAFIQDSLVSVVSVYPEKMTAIDKAAIPLDLFLESEDRNDVIRRLVAMKCQGLMFGKPSEYMDTAAKVLAITFDKGAVNDFIEIKASRDIIIHNMGKINRLYVEKSGQKRRGEDGDDLVIDHNYFRHVIVTLKTLSLSVKLECERSYT